MSSRPSAGRGSPTTIPSQRPCSGPANMSRHGQQRASLPLIWHAPGSQASSSGTIQSIAIAPYVSLPRTNATGAKTSNASPGAMLSMNLPAQPGPNDGRDVSATGNRLAQSGLIRRGQTSGRKAMGPPMRYPIKLALAAPWPGQPRTQRKINEGDNSVDKHRRAPLTGIMPKDKSVYTIHHAIPPSAAEIFLAARSGNEQRRNQ